MVRATTVATTYIQLGKIALMLERIYTLHKDSLCLFLRYIYRLFQPNLHPEFLLPHIPRWFSLEFFIFYVTCEFRYLLSFDFIFPVLKLKKKRVLALRNIINLSERFLIFKLFSKAGKLLVGMLKSSVYNFRRNLLLIAFFSSLWLQVMHEILDIFWI